MVLTSLAAYVVKVSVAVPRPCLSAFAIALSCLALNLKASGFELRPVRVPFSFCDLNFFLFFFLPILIFAFAV